VQSTQITTDVLQSVLGTSEEFLARFREVEALAHDMISGGKHLAFGSKIPDVELMKKTGKLDLSSLTYDANQEIAQMFRTRVLKIDELLSKTGIPGMEFGSSNPYSYLLKFDVEDSDHAAAIFLNRQFFNANPNKIGQRAFNLGMGNMISPSTLERISTQSGEFPFKGDVMTFDVETSGVTDGSTVRSFANRITDKNGVLKSESNIGFINTQMDNAIIRTEKGSMLLSEGVNIVEGTRDIRSMQNGGAEFISATKDLFTQMLNPEIKHLSGHNILFDLQKMTKTLQGLEGYNDDIRDLTLSVWDRVNKEEGFLVDSAETLSRYFNEKLSGLSPADKASRLLSPELSRTAEMGGSVAPRSIQNYVTNSNVLELIERDALAGNEDMQKLQARIAGGAHIAETDVHMQQTLEKYRTSKELDFLERGKQYSPFVSAGRSKYFSSSAINPTTSIADVRHLEQSGVDYLSGVGARHVTVEGVSASELGASTMQNLGRDVSGQLAYNENLDRFQLHHETTGGQRLSAEIDQEAARKTIKERVRQAYERPFSESADASLNIKGAGYSAMTNVEQAAKAQKYTSGITAGKNVDERMIRGLGITNEQFGADVSSQSIFSRFGTAVRGRPTRDIRMPLGLGEEVIENYHKQIAALGLPNATQDVATRTLGVKLSEATAPIANAAAGTTALKGTEAGVRGTSAHLLSETGLIHFNTQQNTALMGQYDARGPQPVSRVRGKFDDIFSFEEKTGTPLTDGTATTTKSLRVKAFGGQDIIEHDLNKFTMSFVNDSQMSSSEGARVNLVWGANKTFSEEQSQLLADHLMGNADLHENLMEGIHGVDELKAGTLTGDAKTTFTKTLAEKIRENGIVVGTIKGDPAKNVMKAYEQHGVSMIQNDVEMLNHTMRIVHQEGNLATFGSFVEEHAAEFAGMTSPVAQRNAEEQLSVANRIIKAFQESPRLRRVAQSTVSEANVSSVIGDKVNLALKPLADFKTPMTNFYKANKSTLGIGALAITALGAGYYMSKKHRESDVYDQTMTQQPFENRTYNNRNLNLTPGSNQTGEQMDPLATAGVVGALDRSRIGHHNMSSNKNAHLFRG
jgi:hypothetical protein